MDKLMEFMDFACIDPSLYWRVTSSDQEKIFEIQWRRDQFVRWRVRQEGHLLWDLCPESSLTFHLEQLGINLENFEAKLKTSLLQQVAYAERLVRDARQVLGHSEVEQAIDQQEKFMTSVQEAIAFLTSPPEVSKPKLRVIRTADPSASID